MAEQNGAMIEVEFENDTVAIPATMTRDDWETHFGDVPDEFEVDRVFVLDGTLRVEAHLGEGRWVEGIRQTEDKQPVHNASAVGWVVETVQSDPPEESIEPGETLWKRD